MKKMKWIIVGLLFAGAIIAKESRPNLLVLLTDDQKVDSLGCYKAEQPLPTPNLDQLASDGIP
jgi:arylsulfatase A-like enzyme